MGGGPYRAVVRERVVLNPDGSWKEPVTSTGESVGEPRSYDQLEYLADSRAQQIAGLQDKVERLLDWSSDGDADGAGVALSSLVRIVGDGAASTRQRIKAAAAVLGYKVQDDGVVEFTKRYLQSVCTSADIANIDYRIEAGELLRRCEDARVVPATVRSPVRTDPEEPAEPLHLLVARRRARQDALEALAMGLQPGRNGNGTSDEPE